MSDIRSNRASENEGFKADDAALGSTQQRKFGIISSVLHDIYVTTGEKK